MSVSHRKEEHPGQPSHQLLFTPLRLRRGLQPVGVLPQNPKHQHDIDQIMQPFQASDDVRLGRQAQEEIDEIVQLEIGATDVQGHEIGDA